MIRPGTIFCAAAVVLVGYMMFQVKYAVMQQETRLESLDRRIADGRAQLRILDAEWTVLTQPTRLNELAQRYLDLVPIGTRQLGAIGTIPLRNPPPSEAPAATAEGQAVATLRPSIAP